MKKLSLFAIVIGGALLSGCGSDNDNEFQLEVSQLTQKDWYYNGYRGDPFSYSSKDVLEVMRFESGSRRLIETEFSGRRDSIGGHWREDGNTLFIERDGGATEQWDILDCNRDVLVVKAWGERTYYSNLSYLEELAGDAFWVNDFGGEGDNNTLKTSLLYRLEGNKNIREAYALLSDTEKVGLVREGNIWKGTDPRVVTDEQGRRVRFYCRIGKNDYVKFDEQVSGDNLPVMELSDFQFRASWTAGASELAVDWKALARADVYYKLEIFEEKSETTPYFVSLLLPPATESMKISRNTNGSVNRVDELQSGKSYKVRLTAILFEPGINANDKNAESNLQAVIYVMHGFVR